MLQRLYAQYLAVTTRANTVLALAITSSAATSCGRQCSLHTTWHSSPTTSTAAPRLPVAVSGAQSPYAREAGAAQYHSGVAVSW